MSASLCPSLDPAPVTDFDAFLDSVARVPFGGESESEPDRTALREAAEALDRARGRLRGRDPNDALSLWKALVSGRWTLVDHYESAGRHILIARRGEHESAPLSNLPPRTRRILAYRAMGQALKFIALELDLSTSTVHRELKRGMAALGLSSSVELARLGWEEGPGAAGQESCSTSF